jgi:predicted Zn-dependent protease
MRLAKSNASDAAWAQLLTKELSAKGRPAGDGWKCIAELVTETGRARQTVDQLMRRLKNLGQVESAWGRLDKQPILFYRPTSKA